MPDSSLALLCLPLTSCSGGALLSPSTSGLITTNSSSPTILSLSSPCNNASSLSPSSSQLNTTTITITSTLTSMVTRCITTTSASPYYSISLSNNSASPTISASTDSSSKSLSVTFEVLVFNSSISKTLVSTLSAKSNTSTSNYVSLTLEMPKSISLSLVKNTTTTMPCVTS